MQKIQILIILRVPSISDFEVALQFWKSARPKLPKMAQNGLKLYDLVKNGNFLPIKNTNYPSKWRAWRVLAKTLPSIQRQGVFWV